MACKLENVPGCTKTVKTCCLECISKEENDCGLSHWTLSDCFDSVEFAEECENYVKEETDAEQ